jgi:hypothetical protein
VLPEAHSTASTLHQLVLVEHGAEPLPLGGVKHCA